MDASNLPIHTQLFELHAGSNREIWPHEGELDWISQDIAVSSRQTRRP